MKKLLVLVTVAVVFASTFYMVYAQEFMQESIQIKCGVDVLKLYVRDNNIFSELKNTGNTRAVMKFVITVDSQTVESDFITLDPGQIRTVSTPYTFASGEHVITVTATATIKGLPCGSFDTESIIYKVPPLSCSNPFGNQGDKVCNFNFNQFFICDNGAWKPTGEVCGNACYPQYTNDYRCSGDWLQRGYRNSDCSVAWQNYQYCNYGCSYNSCNSDPYKQYSYIQCYNGNLWWYDSNGNRQSIYQYCSYGCTGNTCDSRPFDRYAYLECYNGDVWWYNSDGRRESVYQYCSYGCYIDRCTGSGAYRQYAYTQCYNGNLWWYDSNDNRYSVYQYCSDGCYNNRCQPDSRPYSELRCYNSNLWAYDSYGDPMYIYQYCSNGCSYGSCHDYYGACRAVIERFDYSGTIAEGERGFVTIGVKNTGDREERIDVTILVDGAEVGSDYMRVSPGATFTRTFNFYPSTGSHSITAIADPGCGSDVRRSATVYVQKSVYNDNTCNRNGICESWENQQSCPADCPPPQLPSQTSVTVLPESIDSGLYKAKAASINIVTSRPQKFVITVSGVPEDWLSYPKEVTLEPGEEKWYQKTAYIFITPKEAGSRSLMINVKALGENKDFADTVSLFVAPGVELSDKGLSDGITGLATALNNPWLWMGVLIVVMIIIVIIGYSMTRSIRTRAY